MISFGPAWYVRKKAREAQDKLARLDRDVPGWRDQRHANGAPCWSVDGTLLDDNGNRSIFDDVDE